MPFCVPVGSGAPLFFPAGGVSEPQHANASFFRSRGQRWRRDIAQWSFFFGEVLGWGSLQLLITAGI